VSKGKTISFKKFRDKDENIKKIVQLPTFSVVLTTALNGGIAEGRWLEIVGAEGLGKTTLALSIIGNLMYHDKDTYLYIADAEMTLLTEESRLRLIDIFPHLYTGIDVNIDDEGFIYIDGRERGFIYPVETYEELYDELTKFSKFCIDTGYKGILLWDSLVQMTTEEALKGSKQLGQRAKAIQEIINDFNKKFYSIPITPIVINQIRAKINTGSIFSGKDKSEGEMSDVDYSIAGGLAHRFFAFQTLVLVKSKRYTYPKSDKDNPLLDGKIIEIHIKKNKFGRDKVITKMVFIPEIGYSDILSILYNLEEDKVIKSANFIKIPEITGDKSYKLPAFVKELMDNEDMLKAFADFSLKYFLIKYKYIHNEDKFNVDKVLENLRLDVYKLNKFMQLMSMHKEIDLANISDEEEGK